MAIEFGLVFYNNYPEELSDEFLSEQLSHFQEIHGKEISSGDVRVYEVHDTPEGFKVLLVRILGVRLSLGDYFPVIWQDYNALLEEKTGAEKIHLVDGSKAVINDLMEKMGKGDPDRVTLSSASYSTGNTVMEMHCDVNGIVDGLVEADRSNIRVI